MKVYPYFDEGGNLISFEVPNWKVSRNRAVRIVASVESVEIVKAPKKRFSWFREAVSVNSRFRKTGMKLRSLLEIIHGT